MLMNRPGRHDIPAAAGWHAGAGAGGHAGGLEVLWAPGQNCQHSHLLGHDHPTVLSTLAASASEKMHKTRGCKCWFGSTLENDTWHARCLQGRYYFGSRRAVHPSNDSTPLFRQRNEVPPWSTNTAISAFQGKALIAKPSALQVHYNTGKEIWRQCCSASLETTRETHLWELVKLIHKNP